MLDKTSIQLETETVVNGTIAMRSNVYPGKEYILIVVKNANADNLLDSDNLLYIDQKTTESDTVSFDFVPREDVNDFTATIYGVSHLHVSGDPVRENETAATYTSGGSYDEVIYCSACGAELSRETKATDKLTHEHSYQPEVTTDPTCTESGETTYTCSVCGDTYTETIPATGTHIDANNDGKCDTCKQQMTGGKHCKYCGKIHGGAFGWLTKFFHSILAIFKR